MPKFIAILENYFGEGDTKEECINDLSDNYGSNSEEDLEQARLFEVTQEFDVVYKPTWEFHPLPKLQEKGR